MKTTNRRFIKELPWGMMVWQTPDGRVLGDDNGNIMHVFCSDQDPVRMRAAEKAIADAARFYGSPEGKPVFWSGKRPISDEELEEQLARAEAGLVPDPLDYGAIKDEWEGLENERRSRS